MNKAKNLGLVRKSRSHNPKPQSPSDATSESVVGNDLPEFSRTLLAVREEQMGLSLQTIAEGAEVATKTLIDVMRGTYGTRAHKEPTSKQVRGWAEALTRLAKYVNNSSSFNVEPEDVAREFGLFEVKASSPQGSAEARAAEVRAAINRVMQGHEERLGRSDDVLGNIALRRIESGKKEGGTKRAVNVGILRWPPFADAEGTRPIENSWAYQFCARLVGTLNPLDWVVDPRPHASISDALEKLGTGTSGDDLCFGLYDTAYRRLKGYHFINVPGLGVPLHMLKSPASSSVGWHAVATPAPGRPRAFVLEAEAGHLYLAGACQYNSNDLDVIEKYDPTVIAERLLATTGTVTKPLVFIADKPTCDRVFKALERLSGGNPCPYGNPENIDKAAPVYRVGIAIKEGAERWKSLLTQALEEELFRNDRVATAEQYADLLFSGHDCLRLLPLTPQLSEHIAEQFAADLFSEKGGAMWRRIDKEQAPDIKDATKIAINALREGAGWKMPSQVPKN